MKRLFLWILLCVPTIAFGQNQQAMIMDVRRQIGEPDTTSDVASSVSSLNSKIRQWLGEFFREVALYKPVERRTRFVGSAGRDTFALPADFLCVNSVQKTEKKTAKKFFLTEKPYQYQRMDTLIRSTVRPDTSLQDDVIDILLAFRKEPTTKVIIPLIRLGYDSLQKIASAPDDYYTFLTQPKPTILFGKHKTTVDTVFLIVNALVPAYDVVDSTAAAGTTGSRAFLRLTPPLVRADTIMVWYSPRLDTMATGNSITTPLGELDEPVRNAAKFYCVSKYYDLMFLEQKRDYWEKEWRGIMELYAAKKERTNVAPVSAGTPNQ